MHHPTPPTSDPATSDPAASDPAASDPADPAARADVEAAKARSVAQLMMRCARLFDEVALGRLRAASGQPIRRAHTALFPHIELSGSRVTDIAKRAGISKQAVAPLVAELVEWGALERVPDPSDGRARLVRFAVHADGEHAILKGLAVLGALEAELAQVVGQDAWEALHGTLTALMPALDAMRAAIDDP